MKKIRMKQRKVIPRRFLENLAAMWGLPFPPGARLVVAAWVTPGEVSDGYRESLRAHVIEQYGALGVESVVMKRPGA